MSIVKHLFSSINKLSRSHNVPVYSRNCIRFYSDKLGGPTHKVNNLEKKFLVWTGKYKNVNDIPSYVAPEVVEKARNRMRIRVANIMMISTLIACLLVSISGKRAHERGESVQQRNIDWHKQLREEAEKEKK